MEDSFFNPPPTHTHTDHETQVKTFFKGPSSCCQLSSAARNLLEHSCGLTPPAPSTLHPCMSEKYHSDVGSSPRQWKATGRPSQCSHIDEHQNIPCVSAKTFSKPGVVTCIHCNYYWLNDADVTQYSCSTLNRKQRSDCISSLHITGYNLTTRVLDKAATTQSIGIWQPANKTWNCKG